jgi:3-hydroxyacyl-[acyl-carrier-protein] dehydratase
MLLENFYTVNALTDLSEGSATAQIELNPKHEVFEGHFPNNPITPGVSMIQIIKEITEDLLGKKLFLISADNVKFMAIINPETHPVLEMQFDIVEKEGLYKVKNTSRFDDTVALKFSGTFRVLD